MVVVYLVVAVAIAYVLYRFFPTATKRAVAYIQSARKAAFALLYLVTMLVALVAGVWYLTLFGLFLAVLAALQALFEDPFGITGGL